MSRSQMRLFDPADTTAGEVHELMCDTAVEFATEYVFDDPAIPGKWKGPVFRNGAPYNDGRLVLEIVEEYQGAPDKVKYRYRLAAIRAIKNAIMNHQDLFVGLIVGEARAGRNYFDGWEYEPSTIF